jgi:hypothetical protein
MSRERRRGGPGSQDHQTDLEAEAAATVTAIAGLCRRLRRPGMLQHPAVVQGLRRLDEQVIAASPVSEPSGRHRTSVGQTPSCQNAGQISDASGFDFKPDPLAVTTPRQFIGALWGYKTWSGDPSWRKMATQAGQRVVHSTMHAAMHGDVLPKLDVVKAIIIGCGGNEDDLRMFVTAWRRLESARIADTALGTDFLAAPVATLSLVPSG